MTLRKLWNVLPVVAAVLGMTIPAMSQAASAQPLSDLTCVGTAAVSVVPGATLLPTPQHVTVALELGSELSSLTPCTSLTGNPAYTGATIHMVGSGELGCVSGSINGTGTITWNNGDVSTITWSVNLPIFLLPIVNLDITGGPQKGARPIGLGIPTGFSGNCVTNPLVNLGAAGLGVLIGL